MSPNDSAIIGLLCRNPRGEIDRLLDGLEDRRSRRICEAILGRIDTLSLDDDGLAALAEIRKWREYRASSNIFDAAQERRQRKVVVHARRLLTLRDRGQVDDSLVTLYGIHGDLPDPEDRRDGATRRIFQARLQQRLGTRWRQFMPEFRDDKPTPEWGRDGF